MEASLLGYKTLIGSDIDHKAIDATKENLHWVKEHVDAAISLPQLHCESAKTVKNAIQAQKIDKIITETYLGLPKLGKESPHELQTELGQLEVMLKESFDALAGVCAKGSVSVIALPTYRAKNAWIFCKPSRIFDREKWRILPPFTQTIKHFHPHVSENGGLLYAREDQLVGREILKIQRF
jgi:tRNA G10  N-methylase Trm11